LLESIVSGLYDETNNNVNQDSEKIIFNNDRYNKLNSELSKETSILTINSRSDYESKHLINIDQAKELMRSEKTILLDIQKDEISDYINGFTPIDLQDLECGSCIEMKLNSYKIVIVYSENIELRTIGSDILREKGYTVYELSGQLSSDDLLFFDGLGQNNEYITLDVPDEGHRQINLNDSSAKVSVYERNGRIKRIYGEAFSYGLSPEESADNFLKANSHILGMNYNDFHDPYLQPIMYDPEIDQYKFIGLYYNQYKYDIPVFGSRLILLVRNEEMYPLVLASVELRNLMSFEPKIEELQLNPDAGISNAMNEKPDLIDFTSPELIIWSGVDDMNVEPIVAYGFIGDNGRPVDGSNPEKYLYVTNAETGLILYEENKIIFEDVSGNVQGNATQGIGADICDNELPEILPWIRVNIGPTIEYTDENGDFIIPNTGTNPVIVQSRLWGLWVRGFNTAGADALLNLTVTPPGPANFIHNEINFDELERAEVNGYLHANIVRNFTLKHNPSYPGLQQNEFPVYVNDVTGYCPGNAWYDGSSITFCRAGSGYPNTAFSTVIHHEYGHHLVAMAGSGQDAYGEGMSDVMGLLITDNAGTGYGFTGNCMQPLRSADNTIQYPCSGAIHYCGQLLSGCVWETRNELISTNPTTYLDIISNLAVNAMLLHSGSSIDPSITIDYLTLDDDNGNIYDGTPHYNEIATGFGEHNMDAPVLPLLFFNFPDGLPINILPTGGTTLNVVISGILSDPEPGTASMFFYDGSSWAEIPMTETIPNEYNVVFPNSSCGSTVSFYFVANTTTGEQQVWPMDAPTELFYSVSAPNLNVILDDDFEHDKGWTVENSPDLTDGAWERGIPVGGGDRGDPPSDYDGSGHCFLTDNVDGNSDVDDGFTWLISPTLDLSTGSDAIIDYALWYSNNNGGDPNNDLFKVYLSDDDGSSWSLIETFGPETSDGWKVVEAGIDSFHVFSIDCSYDTSSIGDLSSGWNFISLPFNQTIDISDIIVSNGGVDYIWTEAIDPANGPIVDPNVYGWDRNLGMYFQVLSSLEPGYGFWMYSYDDCEIGVENISVTIDNHITDLNQNWNTIGIPSNDPVDLSNIIVNYNDVDYTWSEAINPINGPIVDPNVYGWDRINNMYIPVGDTLDPGYAYWIYSYQICIICSS